MVCWASVTLAGRAEPVDYLRDVQPILARSCVGCHGPKKQHGGLRLDAADRLLQGGDSGPAVVPGKADDSRLVRAVRGAPGAVAMPAKGPRLSEQEIAILATWIDQGAKAPAPKTVAAASDPRAKHWSFRPVQHPTPPAVRRADSVRNGIDRFVLARLEKESVAPSSEADRVTLLRRLSLDLTGLPPTPADVEAFLHDATPDAYERQVERLLASPHFGERWGRHWLDLARYADSNGYSIDSPRSIWPYRDWVISALNRDLRFDQFTVEQLAGDLLPGATTEQRVATGFHRNTQINEEGGIDLEQFRVEAVIDRVNTTGSVWLGLTVGCCQCHNHKFDPLSQREYYQFFAFFNNQDEPNLVLGPGDAKAMPPNKRKKPGPAVLTTMVLQELPAPRKTTVLLGGDFTRPGARVQPGTPAVLPPLAQEEGRRAKDEGRKVRGCAQGAGCLLATPLLLPAVSSLALCPSSFDPNRLDLARWLVSPDNPLTARVLVNRVWGHYFGLGLVETENDFGTQGTPPSHPELLDWLASEFMARGWSLKALHRLIVTSATYRQASTARPDLDAVDPRNRLLARQSRQRLEAEVVRDLALAASGLLDPRLGGPSVFPPQPDGVDQFTQVKRPWVPSAGAARYRRGLYTYFWRAAPHPALTAFDAPDAGTSCTRRNRSNTPLQALTLLNDRGFAEYAYGLAARLLKDGAGEPAAQVRHGYHLCLGREPSKLEANRLTTFLAREHAHYAAHTDEAAALLEGGGPAGERLATVAAPAEQKAALVLLARVLLNLDEFITRE